MPASKLRFVKRCAEWRPKKEYELVPQGVRGIYTLLRKRRKKFDVVYIGLSAEGPGARRRLRSHANSKRKRKLWTHFSLFEVHDNITEAEIAELEGILRHIFRRDKRANRLAGQKAFNKLKSHRVRIDDLREWK